MTNRNAWRSFGAGLVLALALAGAAQASPADTAVLKRVLAASGAPYKASKAENTFTLPYHGKALTSFTVIATADQGLVIIFCNPAKKGSFVETADSLRRMARLNHELDITKVGIDDDGDLFVRVDLYVNGLTDANFKAALDQVAAASDEVYGAMIPYMPRR